MRRIDNDPRLSVRIRRRRALHYDAGADPRLDRPAHVRSASALVHVGDRLLIVQDDASFLAFLDPRTGAIDSVPLPEGPDGRRLFDDHRGNKRHKFDFEAGLRLPDGGALIFGSGSKTVREHILHVTPTGLFHLHRCTDLYRALRRAERFSGSELNVEGAVLLGDRLRLFNRGNGETKDGLVPIDATVDLAFDALLLHLHEGGPPPPLWGVTPFNLGAIDGVRLTFTDATVRGRVLLYTAAAEASANAVDDGPVVGCALGWYDDLGGGWARIFDEAGRPCTDKIEAVLPYGERSVLLAVDKDDPHCPADLLEAELIGPWP